MGKQIQALHLPCLRVKEAGGEHIYSQGRIVLFTHLPTRLIALILLEEIFRALGKQNSCVS
eukprot:c22565_g2_i1 orf=353-535(+)